MAFKLFLNMRNYIHHGFWINSWNRKSNKVQDEAFCWINLSWTVAFTAFIIYSMTSMYSVSHWILRYQALVFPQWYHAASGFSGSDSTTFIYKLYFYLVYGFRQEHEALNHSGSLVPYGIMNPSHRFMQWVHLWWYWFVKVPNIYWLSFN